MAISEHFGDEDPVLRCSLLMDGSVLGASLVEESDPADIGALMALGLEEAGGVVWRHWHMKTRQERKPLRKLLNAIEQARMGYVGGLQRNGLVEDIAVWDEWSDGPSLDWASATGLAEKATAEREFYKKRWWRLLRRLTGEEDVSSVELHDFRIDPVMVHFDAAEWMERRLRWTNEYSTIREALSREHRWALASGVLKEGWMVGLRDQWTEMGSR